jgi:predicted phage tail protein
MPWKYWFLDGRLARMSARRHVARNNHLEEAMALLIHNQAAFVEQIARNDQERLALKDWQHQTEVWQDKAEERFDKIEQRLASIEATLVEMPKTILKSVLEQLPKIIVKDVLDKLPKAVKKEIGFTSPT